MTVWRFGRFAWFVAIRNGNRMWCEISTCILFENIPFSLSSDMAITHGALKTVIACNK